MKRSLWIGIGFLSLFLIISGVEAVNVNKKEIKLLYGQEISVSPDKFWTDKDLKHAFTDYWSFRLSGNVTEAFKMEAPHIQEMINYKRYESLIKGVRHDLNTIKLRKQVRRTERLTEFHGSIMADKEEIAGIRDPWVWLNGKWYHVFKDGLLFPTQGLSFEEEVTQQDK